MKTEPEFNSDKMYLQVLGCGSARPVVNRHPSACVLRLRGKAFLIDCGEGMQTQLMRYRVPVADLHRIFITHLHGDHVLGLPGLMSTLSLIGFTHPYHIYGPVGTEDFVRRIVLYFCSEEAASNVIAHDIDPSSAEEPVPVYEDKSIRVTAFSLNHRDVPCIGYRFDETPLRPHLDRVMADFYEIPVAYFNRLKNGEDYVKPDGTVIPSGKVTKPNRRPYSFAFCSDTSYYPQIIRHIKGVDLLYHEATYMEEERDKAHKRGHSTAHEAAEIARKAKAKNLLIGHFSTRYKNDDALGLLRKEASEVFPRIILAKEGLALDFSKFSDETVSEF